ncbi:MAG: type II 3-dehydroquinate dehydratase [Pseudomonadota bacterium]
MTRITLLNGPNLNLLGKRQPDVYGHETLEDAVAMAKGVLDPGFELVAHQSNSEGTLVDLIQNARNTSGAIIINPGAYSHTSIAILDALNAFEGPVVEVHISQIHKRESFRHHSFVSHRADGVIAGLGLEGYRAAVRYICAVLK